MALLMTKLYIPPIPPEWVSRQRLIERLNSGIHRKLTLVSAPAGFGKTTLLSDWVHNQENLNIPNPQRIAWVSLDSDNDDNIRFWTYFIAALQTVHPELGASVMSLLQSPKPPVVESILTALINEIGKTEQNFIVILDDYHTIESHAIHQDMTFLLDHMPPQLRLVIATRVDPPLPLSRLRGRGQLTEFRAVDLRFGPEEAAVFLNEVMGLDLSDEHVTLLAYRTEGWIASLQMAAISMQGREDIPEFIKAFTGTHRHVADYLTEEVLQSQEPNVRSFLLRTSILNRLCTRLCNAVTGQTNTDEMLQYLVSANMFLVPLDNESQWFRYHSFFADLLHSQLNRTQPDMAPILHERASEWFGQEELTDEAIDHAIKARNFERAADLIESVLLSVIVTEGRIAALGGWLAKLPDELVMSRPWLCLGQACVQMAAGHLNAAESTLRIAESRLAEAEASPPARFPHAATIPELIVALRATLASMRGEVARTIELCHEALAQLPDDQPTARCLVTFDLGHAYWVAGELTNAARYMHEAIALSKITGTLFVALISLGFLADIQIRRGSLRNAAEISREAIRLSIEWGEGEPLPATSSAYTSFSEALYQWDRIDEAIEYACKGIELSTRGSGADIGIMPNPGLARLMELNDVANPMVESLVRSGINHSDLPTGITLNIAEAWAARLALIKGNVWTAEHWADLQAAALDLHQVPECSLEYSYLTLIRLRIAQGNVEGVPEALDRLRSKVEPEGRDGNLIEILILQSLALQSQGKTDQALGALEHAMSLAAPEGYVRIFLDEGQPMIDLLHIAVSRGIMHEQAERLLGLSTTPIGKSDSAMPSLKSCEPLTEPLSNREFEVLQLLASGKSNRAIAEQLVVERTTIKTHINNLYGKLGVHSRTEAIARAKELGML